MEIPHFQTKFCKKFRYPEFQSLPLDVMSEQEFAKRKVRNPILTVGKDVTFRDLAQGAGMHAAMGLADRRSVSNPSTASQPRRVQAERRAPSAPTRAGV